MRNLFIDIETYSSIDLKTSGLYKYVSSPDFEILLISYTFDNEHIRSIDLASGESMPEEFEEALLDENVIKHAHNATFERVCFRRIGYDVPAEEWHCTMIKAAYCGLPLSLDELSKVLDLENKKSATGKALIKYFSCPCKPTRLNGQRSRNYPIHNPDKWNEYVSYNVADTAAEREIYYLLESIEIPQMERDLYVLDQKINDTGILVDKHFVNNAIKIDEWYSSNLSKVVSEKYGIDNPNSSAQLKQWLLEVTGNEVESLAKREMPALLENNKGDIDVSFVLKARQQLSKSSIKKYTAMLNCTGDDNKARGLFQFYGANRTGRWAGRLIQLQNLPQNHLADIAEVRSYVYEGKQTALDLLYDDLSSILSQLIRTAFIPSSGLYVVADFSAIEARVISWLASESWRLEVFETHGKIYEATAARMFNIPIEMVTKGSDLRQKGKVAELALGYQGGLGALKRMGGEAMGLSDGEMMDIVRKWRKANPAIVDFWEDMNRCAANAVRYAGQFVSEYRGIIFERIDVPNNSFLSVQLPSGRKLFYYKPRLDSKGSIVYQGIIQETKTWGEIATYGGKITENIVQAIARDLLAVSMLKIDKAGYPIVMHVHDEVISDVNDEKALKEICDIMGENVSWAEGLSLKADGFVTNFYKKD